MGAGDIVNVRLIGPIGIDGRPPGTVVEVYRHNAQSLVARGAAAYVNPDDAKAELAPASRHKPTACDLVRLRLVTRFGSENGAKGLPAGATITRRRGQAVELVRRGIAVYLEQPQGGTPAAPLNKRIAAPQRSKAVPA